MTQAMRRSLDQLDGHFSRRPPTSSSFLARRVDAKRKFKKKPQKAGAGRELHYERETPEVQKALQGTRTKEWSNWEHYSNGHLITKTELHNMMEEDPTLEVIPTRWVPSCGARRFGRSQQDEDRQSYRLPDYAEHGFMPGYIPRNHFALGRHLSSFSTG